MDDSGDEREGKDASAGVEDERAEEDEDEL